MFCLTDPTLTEHLEIFGVGLWFTPAATSAKLDAKGPPLGHFLGVSKKQNGPTEILGHPVWRK